eukprot:3649254-Ditylum_brightwellii.AAC.1
MAWQTEVYAGFISKNQYSSSGDWNDEPDLGIKHLAKTIANKAVVLNTMSKKVNFQYETSTKIKRGVGLLQKDNKFLQNCMEKMEEKLNSWEDKFSNMGKMMGVVIKMQQMA